MSQRLNNIDQFEEQELIEPPSNPEAVPACIRRYIGVFDIRKYGQFPFLNKAEHVIKLISGTKPP